MDKALWAMILNGVMKMLTFYIQAAMHKARYDILEDGTYYGEIPGFPGVFANADTLETCREQLQEILEGWILLGLRLGHQLPEVGGIKLEVRKEAA
jgi:predicted RNase H-like HicB family nuclease